MNDREKIIAALENCSDPAEKCRDCPYEECVWLEKTISEYPDELIRKAVELLKEHEPRVLTLEELKQFVGHPCWFESSGTYMGKEGFWIIPTMFKMFCGGKTVFYVSVLMKNSDYGMTYHGELGLSVYNKVWRCWSSRPTDEQREAVPWTE